jgi:hypothetical protein
MVVRAAAACGFSLVDFAGRQLHAFSDETTRSIQPEK